MHEIFEESKYTGKIKFGGTKMGEFPSNKAEKIQTLQPLMPDARNFQSKQILQKDQNGENLGVSKWGFPSSNEAAKTLNFSTIKAR